MSLFFADLVREVTHASGSGDLTLEGALPGHRRFADVVPPGARFHYAVAGVTDPGEWETGEGEIGSGGSLLRLPLSSSAGGTAVDFGPGLKIVALTVAAAWFSAHDDVGAAISDIGGLQAALDGKAALAGADFSGAVSAPSLTLGSDLAVADGGTGASSAGAARSNLGLGTVAIQNANAVAITGGTVSGLSSLGAGGDVDVSGDYKVDGVKVISNRRTGWGMPTGPTSRASFESSGVSVAQLAQRVKALIDDLAAHGLIGS